MLLTLVQALETLSSHTLQLVVSLVACGVVLLVVSDHRLAILAFLLQRLSIIVLLWPTIRTPLASTSMIALVAIAFISYITAWCLRCVKTRGMLATTQSRSSLPPLSFRALAASLGVLLTYSLAETYNLNPLPPMVVFTVIWLMVSSLLNLLLADTALHKGLGVLVFADACRVLYALWQPDPLVWGIWNACDVLVALATSFLWNAEAIAAKGQLADSAPACALPDCVSEYNEEAALDPVKKSHQAVSTGCFALNQNSGPKK